MRTKENIGTECWIDERGKSVRINSFFSDTYIDEEAERLTRKYEIWGLADGEQRPGLGSAERECLCAKLLVLVRASITNSVSLVGVKKTELELIAKRSNEFWEVQTLVKDGYLREKWIMGDAVVFPTEKLLKVWGMQHRAA